MNDLAIVVKHAIITLLRSSTFDLFSNTILSSPKSLNYCTYYDLWASRANFCVN